MKNVIVVGGAGFIGSALVRRLLKDKAVESVLVYDNFSSGSPGHLTELAGDDRLLVVEGEISDLSALLKASAGSDTVFHLAANPDIAKAVKEPSVDFWQGTYLMQNVLEAARINGVKRFLYPSGSGVYGDKPLVAFAEDYGPCFPISTYGASKLACEALLCSYCYMFGLQGLAFRFANVVGPRQTHGVGYDFIRKLKTDPTRLEILGNGMQRKSYIHVDDVLNAVFLAADKTSVPFDVFNVSTPDSISVLDVACLLIDVLGCDTPKVSYTGGDRGWNGDVPRVQFDCTKIRRLGWRPKLTSAQAMESALRAML